MNPKPTGNRRSEGPGLLQQALASRFPCRLGQGEMPSDSVRLRGELLPTLQGWNFPSNPEVAMTQEEFSP